MPNESFSATEKGASYIGVPGQGGALIYDVSTLTDEEIASIDLTEFSNVDELGLEELPYGTGGKEGQITVDIHEDDMPYGKHLISHTPEADKTLEGAPRPEDESDVHTLLVAMPYTTNYGSISGGVEKAYLDAYATVNFGNRGYDEDGNSNDYQWMKNLRVDSAFATPTRGPSLTKLAQNPENADNWESAQSAPLGEMVTYRIGNMQNKGNTPLFGQNPDTSYGVELSDQLPSGFQLAGITIRVDESDESEVVRTETPGEPGEDGEPGEPVVTETRNPQLSDWYDTTDGTQANVTEGGSAQQKTNVVQFQTTDMSGKNPQWVSLTLPQKVEEGTGPDGKYVLYRLGDDERASQGIAEMLEAQGIAAVPGRRYEAGAAPTRKFTGLFRVLFKHTLPQPAAGESTMRIASSVDVHGVMMEATSDGANDYYDNKADLTYGERLWTPSGVGPDYGSFSQPKKTTQAAKATFRQVQTNPLITAKVFSMYDGSGATDSAMEKEADKRNALVNEPNAGWRFRFGNTSASRMAPALINIGPIPDGFKYIKDPARYT